MDNGYSKIENVADVVKVMESRIMHLLREANNNGNMGFYVKQEHCHIMAEEIEGLMNLIKGRM